MVEVLDETKQYRPRQALEEAFSRLLQVYNLDHREVTIILCDDAFIHERNLRDRAEDKPTDVLSYPTLEPEDVGFPEIPHLGDIFISLETAARQADDKGHSLENEVKVLAAHGLVHLLGFDHLTEQEWQPFYRAQDQILSL